MFQGFYILTKDVEGLPCDPDGWSGLVKKGTPLAMTYFDEYCLEFITGEVACDALPIEFMLRKPCPVVAACSCPHCGKIVPTVTIKMHIETDDNCRRIWKGKNAIIERC